REDAAVESSISLQWIHFVSSQTIYYFHYWLMYIDNIKNERSFWKKLMAIFYQDHYLRCQLKEAHEICFHVDFDKSNIKGGHTEVLTHFGYIDNPKEDEISFGQGDNRCFELTPNAIATRDLHNNFGCYNFAYRRGALFLTTLVMFTLIFLLYFELSYYKTYTSLEIKIEESMKNREKFLLHIAAYNIYESVEALAHYHPEARINGSI
ncbi:hypothetical protein ACJX0J_033552, partial [Zea mays]